MPVPACQAHQVFSQRQRGSHSACPYPVSVQVLRTGSFAPSQTCIVFHTRLSSCPGCQEAEKLREDAAKAEELVSRSWGLLGVLCAEAMGSKGGDAGGGNAEGIAMANGQGIDLAGAAEMNCCMEGPGAVVETRVSLRRRPGSGHTGAAFLYAPVVLLSRCTDSTAGVPAAAMFCVETRVVNARRGAGEISGVLLPLPGAEEPPLELLLSASLPAEQLLALSGVLVVSPARPPNLLCRPLNREAARDGSWVSAGGQGAMMRTVEGTCSGAPSRQANWACRGGGEAAICAALGNRSTFFLG